MGQTTEIFPLTRKIYKKIFKSKILNNLTHRTLDFFVNCWSSARGFYFPPKFTWEWKLEMLSWRYEKDTVDLFKKIIKPGMVIVDIGAHVGYYTTFFAKLVGVAGAVYAFEADDDNFKILEINTNRYKNVKLFKMAVTDKIGTVDFYKVRNSTGCHSTVFSDNALKIIVSATTLDQFILENDIKHVDVIKIDIEGGEYFAFNGAQKLFANAKNLSIVTEFNPGAIKSAGISPPTLFRDFEKNNFNFFQILPHGKLQSIEIDEMPNLNLYHTGFTNLMIKK